MARDRRGRSPAPKPIGKAVDRVLDSIAPRTPLAAVQTAWPKAVGPQIAAVTIVVEEQEGTLIVECESSVWANELELMAPLLREKLAERMDADPPEKLRFRVARTP